MSDVQDEIVATESVYRVRPVFGHEVDQRRHDFKREYTYAKFCVDDGLEGLKIEARQCFSLGSSIKRGSSAKGILIPLALTSKLFVCSYGLLVVFMQSAGRLGTSRVGHGGAALHK